MGTGSSSGRKAPAIDGRKRVLDAEFERATKFVMAACGKPLVRIGSTAFGIWRADSDLDVAIGFGSLEERGRLIKTVLDKGVATPGVKYTKDGNAILRLGLEGAAVRIDLHVMRLSDVQFIRAGSEQCMAKYTRERHLRWLTDYEDAEKALGLGVACKQKVYRHWVPMLTW